MTDVLVRLSLSNLNPIQRCNWVVHLLQVFQLGLLASMLAACGSGGIGSSNQGPDPVIEDIPVAYVKRPIAEVDDDGDRRLFGDDVRDPLRFRPGAELFLRAQVSPSASEVNITTGAFPFDEFANEEGELLYDVKDLHASVDGTKILFAMRAPELENVDPDEQPTWNIWQYDTTTDQLRRVITSDNSAEEGQDVAPHYLADGRIVFSSTRQRTSKAILLDEGKPQFDALEENRQRPALNLHVMESDGSNINQITFNQSHDIDPILLQNGKVLFTRWDNAGNNNAMNLYQVNPDGTELELLYGHHSHDTGTNNSQVQYIKPRELQDGRIMVVLRPFTSQFQGGDLVAIDTLNYTDHDQPTFDSAGLILDAQESLTLGETATGNILTLAGHYRSGEPMWDGTGRLLVSWSQCRLIDLTANGEEEPDPEAPAPEPKIVPCTEERLESEDYEPADPLYSLWIYDSQQGTQLPLMQPDEGFMVEEGILLQSKPRPAFIPDLANFPEVDSDLVDTGYAVIHIRSVYDFDGVDSSDAGIQALSDPVNPAFASRPLRFLRVVKAVSLPDDDVIDIPGFAFGAAGNQRMKELLGYVPVEPDGSAMFTVPANVAIGISVLDIDGRRVSQRHQNWIHLRPGEVMQCKGCHTADSEEAHGRYSAQAPSINPGAVTSGLPFPNTDPALFADMGETMAQTWARINGAPRALTPDIEYTDQWLDPNSGQQPNDFSYRYQDLQTAAPINNACASNWEAFCRIVVNYEEHIHPLWTLPRLITEFNEAIMEEEVIQDNTCTFCHGPVDFVRDDRPQIPAAQLDLTDGNAENDDRYQSFVELFVGDNEQEIVNGVLTDRLVQQFQDGEPVFETDEEGNLLLDEEGNPIPVLVTVGVGAFLNGAGANSTANAGVLSLFEGEGSHAGLLSAAELKLLSEWLDIGAQYYNNPFDIPQD